MMTTKDTSCVVIGAGIVGLSTAVCLQRRGYSVTVISDRFGADTTSHIAGGVFLPYNRDVLGRDRRTQAIEVVKRSWKHYSRLYETCAEKTGVMKTFGYQCYFTKEYCSALPDTPLVWEVADKLRNLTDEELRSMSPESPCSGWLIQTYIIQCQYYLPYLTRQFKQLGGKLMEKHINSFEEIPSCDVVVNCSGLGAARLCEDNSVFPAQGQVAHVRAPQVKLFFHCEEVYSKSAEERQLLYILPQSGHVLLGGTYTEYSDSILVDDAIRRNFMKKLCNVIPSLQNCEIIKEKCGVRPARDTIRLERERITLCDGRVLQVIHNYGHGGNGIALSWGTAELAADIATSLLQEFKSKL